MEIKIKKHLPNTILTDSSNNYSLKNKLCFSLNKNTLSVKQFLRIPGILGVENQMSRFTDFDWGSTSTK